MSRKDITLAVYTAYILSMLMQFSLLTMGAGTIMIIVTLIATYRLRRHFSGDIHESHMQWLIRTFWIGGSVWLPVMTVVAAIAMVFMTDFTPIREAAERGDILTGQQIAALGFQYNAGRITAIFYILTALFAGWWLYRCGKGIRHLLRGEAVSNVTRWI